MKNLNVFYNHPETQLTEKFLGILDANPNTFHYADTAQCHTLYCQTLHEQVQIIINGGGCYGTLFAGFVGPSFAQAVCEGNFDCAPNAYALYSIAKTIAKGKGILFIANQYTGDFLNNDMAQEFLRNDGIESRACYVSDDIFSARGEAKENRGGLSGVSFVIKAAARAAAAGCCLDEVFHIAEKVNEHLRSVSVCYDSSSQMLEFGKGFSGEPAAITMPLQSSREFVEKAVSLLLAELDGCHAIRYDVLINYTRETSYAEGCILLHDVYSCLRAMEKPTGYGSCACHFDVFDGRGCIISLVAVDEELARYLTPEF